MSQDDEGLGILQGPEEEKKQPTLPPSRKEELAEERAPFQPEGEAPKIFAIKTQVGQERNVSDMLAAKIKKSKLDIYSILAPQELRGYVFVEALDANVVQQTIKVISYARTMLGGEVPFAEVEHFLTPVSAVAKISEGDIVEVVSGPFRGEKAKVTRIDEAKEEITVELFEALVPIPITVKGEHVRVLKRKDD